MHHQLCRALGTRDRPVHSPADTVRRSRTAGGCHGNCRRPDRRNVTTYVRCFLNEKKIILIEYISFIVGTFLNVRMLVQITPPSCLIPTIVHKSTAFQVVGVRCLSGLYNYDSKPKRQCKKVRFPRPLGFSPRA
jgi:hypothetical protein